MKPFKCNVCDASFSQKGILKEHVESVLDLRILLPFIKDFVDTEKRAETRIILNK